MNHVLAGIACAVALFASLIGILAPHAPEPSLGVALPSGTAVFETSLASRISSTDTSMTLVSTTTRGSGSLTGYQCFTIDEGRTDAEFVCGTLTSAKTATGLTRGLDPLTGTTTNATLQFAHRVGANVKITDFPLIAIMRAMLNGSDTIPNLLTYANTVLIVPGTATSTLATKYYVDTTTAAGCSNADTSTKGCVEQATQIEAASSTSLGSTGAVLFVPASMSTSSPGTAGLWNVVTMNNGRLSQSFFDLTLPFTFSGGFLSTASSTFNTPTTTISSLLAIATGTPPASGFKFVVGGSGYLSGGLSLGIASTTGNGALVMSFASTTNLVVSGTCTGCSGATQVTNTASLSTSDNTDTSATATCAGSKLTSGGGFTGPTNGYTVMYNYPSATNAWSVDVRCEATGIGACNAGTLTVYAVCVNP